MSEYSRLRPNRIAPAFALAAALVAALTGCGSDNPATPKFIDGPGHIVSVTLPESLAAGDSVDVSVDLGSLSCGQSFRGFGVLRVIMGEAWITPVVRSSLGEYLCPDLIPPHSIPAFRARVPASGTMTLHVVGRDNTVDVALTPGFPAAGSEHRVVLVPQPGSGRVDSLALSWFHGPTSSAVLVAHTDAQGVAVANLPCFDVGGDWSMYLFEPGSSQLVPLCVVPQSAGACVRAPRTIVPYKLPLPAPSATVTSWRVSPALYARRLAESHR